MKQNTSFLLQELAGVPYLLPYGQMIADHKRGLKTNTTGAYLWNLLETEHTMEEILSLSTTHYAISDQDLPGFHKDITQFIRQLLAYRIIVESGNTYADQTTAISALEASRNSYVTAIQQTILSNDQTNCTNQLLSIGGLTLQFSGPATAFPPAFENFVITDTAAKITHIHQKIILHPDLPQQTTSGQLLLHNHELVIFDLGEQYLLHFPTAKQHLEVHFSKDGAVAHCYCPPPYNKQFHYDLFHAIRLIFLYLAQLHGMAALHSASILYQDKLWLFSGHSGAGKSTHTNLWKEIYNTPIINGDLNLLAIENDKAIVHGIPWCGTSGICDTKTYPLGGIILLSQAKENFTEELSEDQKQLLVSQRLISPSWTKEQWYKNLDLVEHIMTDILVCKLHCTKEKEAVEVMKSRIEQFTAS